MKSLLIILTLCISTSLIYAQKYQIGIHGGTFWDKGLNVFLFQKNTFAYTHTSYHGIGGVTASMNISKQFSIISGYDFSYRYLEVNLFANNPVNSFTGSKLYTHSIPVMLEYKFERTSFGGKSIIFRAGGGLEIFTPEYKLFGMYNSETVFSVTYKYGLFFTMIPPKNPIPFLQGYIGFGDHLGKNGNISIGAGYKLLLSKFKYEMYYYFQNSNSPEVEQTFPITTTVSELSIDFAYTFGLSKRKSVKKTE